MTPAPFIHVTHVDRNGTWLVALEGEHDIATRPLLEHQTGGVWPHCTVAVIDLSAATFIDCSVVSWLVRSRDALSNNTSTASSLRIVDGQSASIVQRLIEVLGLREEFDCYATRKAALAGLHDEPHDERATSSTPRGASPSLSAGSSAPSVDDWSGSSHLRL